MDDSSTLDDSSISDDLLSSCGSPGGGGVSPSGVPSSGGDCLWEIAWPGCRGISSTASSVVLKVIVSIVNATEHCTNYLLYLHHPNLS